MEGLAVASGVIAVVTLAGQVLSGLRFLDEFFGDVADAPEYIQLLKREIEVLKVIMRAVAQYDVVYSPPGEDDVVLSLGPLLEMCKAWVTRLETAMKNFEAKSSTSRVQRHWRDFLHALQQSRIEKYITRLSRVRASSMQAQFAVEGPRRLQLYSDITTVLKHQASSTQSIAAMRGELVALALEQSRRSSPTNQTQMDLATTVSTLARDQSASAQILRRIDRNLAPEISSQRRAADAHDITRSILSSSNFSDSIASYLMPALQPHISEAIDRAFQNTIDKRETAIEMQDFKNNSANIPRASSKKHDNTLTLDHISTDPTFVILPNYVNDSLSLPLPWRRSSKTMPRNSRTYNAPLGTLICRTSTTVQTEKESFTEDCTSRAEIFICRIVYILPRWLVPWLSRSRLKWMSLEIKSPSFHLVIEPIRIVPCESKILIASSDGDLQTVRQLLSDHEASIYDRNEDGETLLDTALQFDSSADFIDFKLYRPKLQTAFWLLDQGIDSGATDFRSKGSSMEKYVRNFVGFFDKKYDFNLEMCLISSMIQKAKTDPFQDPSGYLSPRTWGWNEEDSSTKFEQWGRSGTWTVLLPAILRQDVWPFEYNLESDENLFYLAMISAFQIYDLYPREVSFQTSFMGKPVIDDFHKPVFIGDKTADEAISGDANRRKLVAPTHEKLLYLKMEERLLSEKILMLKLIFTKWSIYGTQWHCHDGIHLAHSLGEELRRWQIFAYDFDSGMAERLTTATIELFEILVQSCVDRNALTVFGTTTYNLFEVTPRKAVGWPPRSRIAIPVVDKLVRADICDEDLFIPPTVDIAGLSQSLLAKCAIPGDMYGRAKRTKKIPLIGSIATVSAPRRLKDNEYSKIVSVSLCENIDDKVRDIHDEIADTDPLDMGLWVCELSFDTPSELSITLLSECEMAVVYNDHVGCYKEYKVKNDQDTDQDTGDEEPSPRLESREVGDDATKASECSVVDVEVPGAWYEDDTCYEESDDMRSEH